MQHTAGAPAPGAVGLLPRQRDRSGRRRAAPPRSRADAVALAVAAALGTWTALWRLDVPSSVNDELVYRRVASAMLAGDWSQNLEHPPLAKELLALTSAALVPLGVPDLFADRLPGALCFVLTGLVVAATARLLRGPAAGVVAGLLWWLLPLAPGIVVAHVDRYALLEAPMLLFSATATWTAVQLCRRPSTRGWVVAGAAVGLATASKLTGALSAAPLLVPAVLGLLGTRTATRATARTTTRATTRATTAVRVVLAGAVAVAVFLATYAPMGRSAPAAVRTVVAWQLHHASGGHLQTVAGVNHLFPPWWSPWWFQAQYLGWAALAALWTAALAGGVVVLRTRGGAAPVGGLAATAAALVLMTLKLPHYHDAAVPLLDVLAGCAAAALAGAARRAGRWRWTAGLALAVLVTPLAVRAGTQAADVAALRPGDYRLAAAQLRDRGLDSATVTVWGDGPALREQLPGVDATGGLPPDGRPAALLVDSTVVGRLPGVGLAAWRRGRGADYSATTDDRLTLYVRP